MTQTLRPLTIGELLDRTFTIYRRHFLLLVGITSGPALIRLVLDVMRVASQSEPFSAGSIVFTLLSVVVGLVTVMLAQGAVVSAVSAIQLGRTTSITESLQSVRPRIVPLIVTSFVVGIFIVVGFLFLIIPGIILSLMWALVVPVVVVEQRTLLDAASRSAELTQGGRGRIFVIYVVLIVLYLVVSLIAGLPMFFAVAAATAFSVTAGQIVAALWAYAVTSVVSPLLTVGLTLVYYDQRVRKEAFDLEHMMATLDDGAAAPAH